LTATVSIIIGSESDLDLANKCGEVLSSFSIDFSVNVLFHLPSIFRLSGFQ